MMGVHPRLTSPAARSAGKGTQETGFGRTCCIDIGAVALDPLPLCGFAAPAGDDGRGEGNAR
jgi:hypothetical protein